MYATIGISGLGLIHIADQLGWRTWFCELYGAYLGSPLIGAASYTQLSSHDLASCPFWISYKNKNKNMLIDH